MFTVLGRADFHRAAALVGQLHNHGMARSVVAGFRTGLVAVNDSNNPAAMCIAAPEGKFAWVYLAGKPDEPGFGWQASDWIFEQRGLGESGVFIMLACGSREWDCQVAAILGPRAAIPDRRLNFARSDRPTPGWQESIPTGYDIRVIDQAFLALAGIATP